MNECTLQDQTYKEELLVPTFELESTFSGLVCGIDEVGRGPWAGPVVAASFIFLDPPSLSKDLQHTVKDSKKLSPTKREELYHKLVTLTAASHGVGLASVQEIDQLNILKATFLAMERSVTALPQRPHTCLIDGKYVPSFPDMTTHAVIKGDDVSLSIAAASIIAKVTRDRIMADLAKQYPMYNWQKNAGYGTAEHQKALRLYGVSPHHRKSFAPIRKLLETSPLAV